MNKILIIGAGRSTLYLVEYLASKASEYGWKITVSDQNLQLAKERAAYPSTTAMKLDINDEMSLASCIENHDIVVSMLPAHLHLSVAIQCLKYRKHLCTASYLTDEMKALHKDVKNAGLTFINELGLDPGLDHLSAMSLIDKIKSDGGVITEFESFAGGLIAPESDDNPWNYKFTWNPRNVVLAGQGGAVKFIQNGLYKFIPYHKLFRRTEVISIDGYGTFEGYANRDSLKYRETYGIENIKTMYRGTLRRPGFCRAWDQFVQLGATDDSFVIPDSENLTYREFINTFLAYNLTDSVEIKLRQYLRIDQDDVDLWNKLEWLDIFSDTKVGIKNASPAMILEHILSKKWTLLSTDKDMIVMWHKLVYNTENGIQKMDNSSMVVIGEDMNRTAMSKTVGLPLAIGCKLLITGHISEKGTILPIIPSIYEPILEELKSYGITFKESSVILT